MQKLWKEWRGTLVFLLLMCAFRSSFADIYQVPTGSMKPTVVEGDRVVTDKMAYYLRVPFTGLVLWHRADPQRGGIVTLDSPEDGMRLLKRVVGMPGDVIPQAQLPPSAGAGVDLPDAADYVFPQEDLGSRWCEV